jgi:hypothetical protein
MEKMKESSVDELMKRLMMVWSNRRGREKEEETSQTRKRGEAGKRITGTGGG